jgi:hypothetical protein
MYLAVIRTYHLLLDRQSIFLHGHFSRRTCILRTTSLACGAAIVLLMIESTMKVDQACIRSPSQLITPVMHHMASSLWRSAHSERRTVSQRGCASAAPRRRNQRTTAAIWSVSFLALIQLVLLQPCSASYTIDLEPDEVQCFYVLAPADRAATLRFVVSVPDCSFMFGTSHSVGATK